MCPCVVNKYDLVTPMPTDTQYDNALLVSPSMHFYPVPFNYNHPNINSSS